MKLGNLENFVRNHSGKKGIDYLNSSEKQLLHLTFLVPIGIAAAIATPVISFIRKIDHQDPYIEQKRISGKLGEITIKKFQTLIPNAHLIDPDIPISDISDPRIAKFGRWVRFCELDEIPQLPLLLTHKLDLLGVRTLLPKDVQLVKKSDPEFGPDWEHKYLTELPRCGIITPHSLRDPERKMTHGRNIPYDLDYMKNASLGLDLFYYLFEVGPFVATTLFKGIVKNVNYLLNNSSAGKKSTS